MTAASTATAQNKNGTSAPLNVLVIDDEAPMRELVLAMLERSPHYRAEAVGSAKEGLARLIGAGNDPSGDAATGDWDGRAYQLVLCDVKMPRMNGLEFVDAAVQAGVGATIIMMSAFGTVDLALDALRRGAYDYMSKPFKRDALVLTLRKATERLRLHSRVQELEGELARLEAIEKGDRPLLGRSEPMLRLKATIAKVAGFDTTVLVTGESGTGKELVARAIHQTGQRRSEPFVAINCGAIPATLLESELFGHVRGAFTDARTDKPGLFVEADGGTLLLDEVGELPTALQVGLLRVLQEGEIRPVGSTKNVKVNVRIVAATHRNLHEAVAEGDFREDLFYRLNVLQIEVPALRDRPEDIPLLTEYILTRVSARMGVSRPGLSKDATKLLVGYPWPGNVRELENVLERAVVLCDDNTISAASLPKVLSDASSPVHVTLATGDLSIKKAQAFIERELIRRALKQTGGNRTHAAQLLEISHRALLYKLKDYALRDE